MTALEQAISPAPARRLKVILFPLGWLLAHVGRLVEIGKVLRARGHEVIFAGDDPAHPRSKLSFAQIEGFPLRYAKEPDHPYAWDRYVRHGWKHTAWDLLHFERWAPLDAILEGHVELIRREKPDLIVGDGTISVSTAGHITGVPAAGVMNAYAGRFAQPGTLYHALIRAGDAVLLSRVRNRVYRKYGVRPADALSLLKSTPMVSPDLPGLYPAPSGWRHWHVCGPIISEPPASLPEWYDELDDGTPNVYVTMGSTGLLDEFLRRTAPALGKLPYRFLVTTAGQVEPETMRALPSNFRVATYGPGSKLLEKSRALIFHGGNGSMYQALAQGVPMVALPLHLEQQLCANIAASMGVCLTYRARNVEPARLIRLLERVLSEPHFRDTARRIAPQVCAANGAESAALYLERVALGQIAAPSGAD